MNATRWVLCLLVVFGATTIGDAGHDVFVQVVLQEAIPGQETRTDEPVSFAIPVPASAELSTLDRIIVIGLEAYQLEVLGLWGNGAVRWLGIHGRVTLQPSEQIAAVYVANGEPDSAGPDLATARFEGEEWHVDTGVDVYRVMETEDLLRNESQSIVMGFYATQERRRAVGIESAFNGPLEAELVREEIYSRGRRSLVVEQRARFYKDKPYVDVTFALHRAPLEEGERTLDDVVLVIRTEAPRIEVLAGDKKTKHARANGERVFSAPKAVGFGSGLLLLVDTVAGVHVGLEELTVQLATREQPLVLAPGGTRRWRMRISSGSNLSEQEQWRRASVPIIGKAVSVNVYNDAGVLDQRILAGESSTVDGVASALQHYLSDRSLAAGTTFEQNRFRIEELLREQLDPPAELLTWAYVSLDRTLAERLRTDLQVSSKSLIRNIERSVLMARMDSGADLMRSAWSDGFLAAFSERQMYEQGVVDEEVAADRGEWVCALWDLLSFCQPRGESPDLVLDFIEVHGRSLVANSWDATRRGWSASRNDPAQLDRVLAITFQVTGDEQLWSYCRDRVRGTDEVHPNLRYLVEERQRHRVWQPVELDLGSTEVGSRLSWVSPGRGEVIRIKGGDAAIDPAGFARATNLESEPQELTPGKRQSLEVVGSEVHTHYAGRVRIRGTALPTPVENPAAHESASGETQIPEAIVEFVDNPEPTRERRTWFVWTTLALLALAALGLYRRRR